MTIKPPARTLLDLLDRSPYALLVFKDEAHYGERVLAVRALRLEAERLAGALAEQGVTSRSRVTLLLSGSSQTLIAFWACVMLGAAPLIAPVEHHRLARLLPLLEQGEVVVLDQIMEQTTRLLLPSSVRPLNVSALRAHRPIKRWHEPEEGDEVALRSVSFERAERRPRLCSWTHDEALSALHQHAAATRLNAQSVSVSWMALSQPVALLGTHLCALHQHAAQVLLSPYTFPDDPWLWLAALHQHRATHAVASRSVVALLLAEIAPSRLEALDLSAMRSLWLGPEPPSVRDAYELGALLRRGRLKRGALHTGFAMAEGSLCLTSSLGAAKLEPAHIKREALLRGRLEAATAGQDAVALLPLGRPLMGATACVLDASGEPLEDDLLGELHLSSRALAQGGKTDQTSWIATGELAFMRRGELFTLGLSSSEVFEHQGHQPRQDPPQETRRLFAFDLEALVTEHAPEQLGAVAALRYVSVDQAHHTLIVVAFLDFHATRARERLEVFRAHLEARLPEAGTSPERLSLVAVSLAEFPHEPTHRQWRDALLDQLEQGGLDAVLVHDGAPLPKRSSSLERAVLRAPALKRPAERLQLVIAEESSRVELLEALNSGKALSPERGPALTLELTLSPEGELLATRSVGPMASAGLLAAKEVESLEEATEPIAVSASSELTTLRLPALDSGSLDPIGPGVEIFSTRPLAALSAAHTVAISALQRDFLTHHQDTERAGWIELGARVQLGALKPDQVTKTLRALVETHEALRAELIESTPGGEHTQHLRDPAPLQLELLEVGEGPEADAARMRAREALRAHATGSLYGRVLTRWLVTWSALRSEAQVTMLTHHVALDEKRAARLLGEIVRRLEAGDTPPRAGEAPGEAALYAITAKLEAINAELNRQEYWATRFARPYRHVSLRDATFSNPRRVVSSRAALERHGERLEAELLQGYALFLFAQFELEVEELIVSCPHDFGASARQAELGSLSASVPVRLKREVAQNGAALQVALAEARAHALSAAPLARAANLSLWVAGGARFAFRVAYGQGLERHRFGAALSDTPLPSLNELCLRLTHPEAQGAQASLTLEVGEDVHLKTPLMRALEEILASSRRASQS